MQTAASLSSLLWAVIYIYIYSLYDFIGNSSSSSSQQHFLFITTLTHIILLTYFTHTSWNPITDSTGQHARWHTAYTDISSPTLATEATDPEQVYSKAHERWEAKHRKHFYLPTETTRILSYLSCWAEQLKKHKVHVVSLFGYDTNTYRAIRRACLLAPLLVRPVCVIRWESGPTTWWR